MQSRTFGCPTPVRAALLTGALAASMTLGLPASAQAAATSPVARWEMNESAGARTMTDSSGNGLHGSVGTAVQTGVTYDGATAYRWSDVHPNEPPAKPERLVTVASSWRLNPGTSDYAVSIRFRTTHSFGNIIQKGQSGAKGGYFKLQNVRGKVTCLFRGVGTDGAIQSKAVNSGIERELDDGAWHTLRCERTADRLVLVVDGIRTRRGIGPTGSISNRVPLTIGGKPNCDQVKVTCDYFAGDIDYVRIDKG